MFTMFRFCLVVEGVSKRQCPCGLLTGYTPEDTSKTAFEAVVGSNAWWSDGRLSYKYRQGLSIQGPICLQGKVQEWVSRFYSNEVFFFAWKFCLKIFACHNFLIKYFISTVLICLIYHWFCIAKNCQVLNFFAEEEFFFWKLIFTGFEIALETVYL